MNSIRQARIQVLETAKQAFSAGLFAGTSGNLSLYLPEEGLIAITPSSIRYEAMEEEDIVILNSGGLVIEGKHRPSSEYQMHCAIYEAHAERGIHAVVHTHSPYATSFAVSHQPIPLILIEMIAFLGGEVPLAPLEVPGSTELGTVVARTLWESSCCLMANHGVIATGGNMEQAYLRAEYVEDAAKICRLAGQSGITLIPEEFRQKMM